MKKSFSYYKIKWTAFFLTVLVLVLGLSGIYLTRREPAQAPQPQTDQPEIHNPVESTGYYTNEAFSKLIENNLSELGFLSNIQFEGEDEGRFKVSGTLSDPARLTAACPDLKPFEKLLSALKGESIVLRGHVGESADGNGQFIADTITFSDYTLSAAVATPYIDEYTGLNDLLAVPYSQISVSESGVTFQEELPAAIQIVSNNAESSAPRASS